MSEHDPDRAPDLDPAEEQRVRGLLADLGSSARTEPLPADVAARLDDTLAGLVAERGAAAVAEEHTATGQVVPMRPRWMPRVVAAAAAVIVLGLAGLVVVDLDHQDHAGSSTAADSAGSSATAGTPLSSSASPTLPKAAAGLPQLDVSRFSSDVSSLLGATPSLRAPARVYGQSDRSQAPEATSPRSSATPSSSCPVRPSPTAQP